MFVAVSITLIYAIVIWLIFFKFRWLKFNVYWGMGTFWVGVHFLIIFLVMLRFYQPMSLDAHTVRPTIQITPRLSQPTLLTEVLVEPNQLVKKGDPLYRLDDTIYKAQVELNSAKLVAAQQNALIVETDVEIATDQVAEATAKLTYAQTQQARYANLVPQGGARQEELDRWIEQVAEDTALLNAAEHNLLKAQQAFDSQIDGVYTGIIEAQSQLDEASYFLRQTTIYAPEDGMIVSQQARPGMVVGQVRLGAIAAFITDEDPYILATFRQQNLKFVQPGQEVEIALDLYPGRIIQGKVEAVWWATSQGQFLPSGRLPEFVLPRLPGRIAVQITFDAPDDQRIPTGGHAGVAIYTGGATSFEWLRRINIRLYSFANFVRPLPI